MFQALRWSIQDELEEAGGDTLEEVLTISVCPTIQNMVDTHPECRGGQKYLEQNTKQLMHYYHNDKTTMSRVLSVMLLQERES